MRNEKEEIAMNDVGRNSPCPCGSGKKYKRCCLENTNKTKSQKNSSLPSLTPSQSRLENSKILMSHPSMPKVYGNLNEFSAYTLPLLSIKELLMSIGKGKTQKELDDNLIHLNKKSHLYCFFSRRGESIYFNLYNETTEVDLQIDAEGKIYFSSMLNTIAPIPVIYLLYRLLTENHCPWNFEKIKKSWPTTSLIAKSLFNFRNQKDPLCLKGIILKTDKCDESQMVEIGKSINQLEYLNNIPNIELNPNDHSGEMHKTIFPLGENQENLFHYIQYGTTRRNFWWNPSHQNQDVSSWDHIQYLFSDNTIFTIKELLNHPYAVLLPQELVPNLP
jgi:hypothetical protein